MRIDFIKTNSPITVVGRAIAVNRHGLLANHRSHPNSCKAQRFDIWNLFYQSLNITTVVKPRVSRIKTRYAWCANQAALIIGGITISKAIQHDKIDHLWMLNF